MSKYQPDGTHEVTIVRERVRDMQTEHISFGRLKALAEREQKRKQNKEQKVTKKPELKRNDKRSKSPNSPKRR